MRKFYGIFLCLCQALMLNALHFSTNEALSPKPAEDSFSLQTYIQGFLQNSPELKADKNTLSIAENHYKNAFTDAFLPTFSVSAGADKSYNRAERFSSWSDFRSADSSAQASGSWNLFNNRKRLSILQVGFPFLANGSNQF